jgi:hypothetical protein
MSHIVFSRANICRVTWLDTEDIQEIYVKDRIHAIVTLVTGEKIKVQTVELLPVMESVRRERAKNIEIKDIGDPDRLYAHNVIKDTHYSILPLIPYMVCECADYKNQSIFFDRNDVCCKHIYAALNYLGFKTLEEYQQDKYLEQLYQKELERQDYLHLAYSEY